MKHHQLPLPKKDHRQAANSRSKYTENRRPHETSKECVDYVLPSATEDASSESLIDNTEVFLFSEEIHDGDQILESSKNFIECPIPRVSSSSSSSSAITAPKDEAGKIASSDSDFGMSNFLEVEMVISHLREARAQILNSVNVDGSSKSIVDALIDVVISNLDGMSGDNKDRLPNLLIGKTHILLLLFVTWILVTFMFLLFGMRGPRSFTEPPPT